MRLRNLILTATAAVACLTLTACNEYYEGFRAYDAQEQKRVEERQDSVIQAFMAGKYRALGVADEETDEGKSTSGHGNVMFAQCDLTKTTLQACEATPPTLDHPHVYVPFSWNIDSFGSKRLLNHSGDIRWQAMVGDAKLDCTSAAFQLNAFSITQVPMALKMFAAGNKPVTGDKETDLPPNPDPKGPYSMGKVRWNCGVLES